MKKLKLYVKAAFYHIRQNKNYFFFSLIGTMLTFLFINIILQVVYSQIADTPPNINTERIISLNSLTDSDNKPLLLTRVESFSIVSEIKESEAYSLNAFRTNRVTIHEKRYLLHCCYSNSGLWNVKKYSLLEGRFFTEEECENRTPVVLVREGAAEKFFTGSPIGQSVEIQKKEFKIIGIIKDYPFQIGPGGIPPVFWIPHSFLDKDAWEVTILFPKNIEIEKGKQIVARSLNYFAEKKGDSSTFTSNQISTVKEMKGRNMKTVLIVFSSAIIFLLLIIPAINMFTLNLANTANRATEIAIQRAFGASKASSFFQIIIENILTTTLGAILGICLSYPFVAYVQAYLIPTPLEGSSLTIGVNLPILLFGVFPLILLLSIISGGLPAYVIAKQNIAKTLKGGSR